MVTFVTVAVILTVVFIVIALDVHDRVCAAETDKLKVSENVFTALDTYFTERRFSGSSPLAQLLGRQLVEP